MTTPAAYLSLHVPTTDIQLLPDSSIDRKVLSQSNDITAAQQRPHEITGTGRKQADLNLIKSTWKDFLTIVRGFSQN
jgi:hypothetical protein